MRYRLLGVIACVMGAMVSIARGDVSFKVSFEKELRSQPASGRLVVYLVKVGSPIDLSGQAPGEGPFFEDPQPMFGVDVEDLTPGRAAVVNDEATSFPSKLSALAPGRYRAQAVLDVNRDDSSWKREPGNLYSKTQEVTIEKSAGPIEIKLTQVVKGSAKPSGNGVEFIEVKSDLLSTFRGREVKLCASIVVPQGFDEKSKRKYPAVYEIPGFGGDHSDVRRAAMMRRNSGASGELLRNCFWIELNPEGPNGHHLFANSDNNGPVGDALVKELIPAIEAKYPLIAEASARLLRGHSSGGWSSLWLALNYPETFGATWSTSPDPVDFHHFQIPDIYEAASMYSKSGGRGGKTAPGKKAGNPDDIPSFRDTGGSTRMTIRDENRMEEVIGPNNTSGQQWDSWLAAFGPRDAKGNPAALYDPETGALDHKVAEHFRKYDILDLLKKSPEKYGVIFKQRVRILVGDQDNYFLNEAVETLKAEVDKLSFFNLPEGSNGYIKILPGRDHGTIMMTPEMQAIPKEMLEHLKRTGHVAK